MTFRRVNPKSAGKEKVLYLEKNDLVNLNLFHDMISHQEYDCNLLNRTYNTHVNHIQTCY